MHDFYCIMVRQELRHPNKPAVLTGAAAAASTAAAAARTLMLTGRSPHFISDSHVGASSLGLEAAVGVGSFLLESAAARRAALVRRSEIVGGCIVHGNCYAGAHRVNASRASGSCDL